MSFENDYFQQLSQYRKWRDFQTGCSSSEQWYLCCFNYLEKKYQFLNGAQRIALDLGFGYGGVMVLLK